jgi:two-component system, NtrC family, nitrogen regulation response regulator GlnG
MARRRTEGLTPIGVKDAGCVLAVVEGDDAGKRFVLTSGKALIGSDESCDFVLTDRAVSGQHASVEVVPEGLLVTDLGSTNGTFYRGGRVAQAVLPHGAELVIGRSRLVLAASGMSVPEAPPRASYGKLLGASAPMQRLYATLARLEKVEHTVLLLGETGVGKELVAREIHAHSRRAAGPFEVCDCAALAPTLAESELFGHVRGAFTGAQSDHRGVFERADGGTVFLDEVGELPQELQPKLLRVLESRTIRRVGGNEARTVDVRIVAATNRDLEAEVKAGRFRQDLFFRLNAVALAVPSLRERREDIPRLVRAHLDEIGQGGVALSPGTLELLASGYDWPGNVRELRNAVARVLTLGSLPESMGKEPAVAAARPATFQEAKRRIVDAFERDYLAAKLEEVGHNISRAAREAGVERTHFRRLLKKHGLGS